MNWNNIKSILTINFKHFLKNREQYEIEMRDLPIPLLLAIQLRFYSIWLPYRKVLVMVFSMNISQTIIPSKIRNKEKVPKLSQTFYFLLLHHNRRFFYFQAIWVKFLYFFIIFPLLIEGKAFSFIFGSFQLYIFEDREGK